MSTNNDGWILMSERKPGEGELPAWVANTRERPVLVGGGPFWHWTHWKPADIPAPPREKTQRDKDGDAFRAWREPYFTVDEISVWLAALAYERAEVGKMLPKNIATDGVSEVWSPRLCDAIEAIRARCGGGK